LAADADTLLKLLPSALVVGGWLVVYQLQALQARRKVLREEAEKARNVVEALRAAAIKFHLTKHSAPERLSILSSITDIERRCAIFPRIASRGRSCLPHAVDPKLTIVDSKYIVRLRQAITLEHFDDPNAEPLHIGSPQVSKITDACQALILSIDGVLIAALD
jgi:hypothetical protein